MQDKCCHFAINTKSEQEIVDYYKSSHPNSIIIPAPQIIIGKQFSHLFNGYSQAINKSYNRTGALFEQPFRRIHFDNESYLCELIRYIHRNPQNHKIIQDFREYLHSSFNSILSDRPTKLLRNEVFALFGGVDKFRLIHENDNLNNLDKYDIE